MTDVLDAGTVPTDRDTGFNEPLSTARNTTLPHPDAVNALPVTDEEQLRAREDQAAEEHEHVGFRQKVKGEIKIIEGKVFCNPRLVEEGRALKHGIAIQHDK